MPETQLRTTLTLNNGQFIAACDDSQARTGKFQNAVGGGTGNFVKFNTHMLTSRKTMHLMGEAAGVNLGMITRLAYGFGTLGIAATGAIAAMIAIREVVSSNTTDIKNAADKLKDFYTTVRDLRMESEGLEFNKAAKALEKLGEKTEVLRKQMADMEGSWITTIARMAGGDTLLPDTAKVYLEKFSEPYKSLQQGIKDAGKETDELKKKMGDPAIIRKGSEHGGGGAAHIGQAHYGNELGAYKAEHGSSLVDIARKTLEVQEKTLVVLEKRTAPREPGDLVDNF